MTRSLRTQRTIAAALLSAACAAAALEAVPDGLPPVAGTQAPNPYRGQPAVAAAGRAAYESHCAECHGAGARTAVAEAPDLRRLNGFCLRLGDPPLRAHCLRDVDTYFMQSVLEGKRRAGLMHMPAWREVLPPETIWAIRSYIETQALPPPRTLPDLPPVPVEGAAR